MLSGNDVKPGQIMNRIFLLLLISSSCRFDSMDVINDPSNIPDAITEKLSALELIKTDERILTGFHKRLSKIPPFEPTKEEFLVLTDQRFF
jgi:hypothetical protein